jgi:hypothetical protein
MRKVAMKLHTKEQAPKEGGKAAPAKPQAVSGPVAGGRVCVYVKGGGGQHKPFCTAGSVKIVI